jgi:hypothetical protein
MARGIEITNGGEKVDTNEFVREATINVIVGLMKSLRGVDTSKEITIRIEEEK